MESRNFIKLATDLRADISDFGKADLSDADAQVQGNALQRRIDAAFVGLQNPTLSSAANLASEAIAIGFTVNPSVISKIHQHEHCWPR
jgi:hypothetical protein